MLRERTYEIINEANFTRTNESLKGNTQKTKKQNAINGLNINEQYL